MVKRFAFFRYLFLIIGLLACLPNMNAFRLSKASEGKHYISKHSNQSVISNAIDFTFSGLFYEEMDDEFSDDDADHAPEFTCGRPFVAYLPLVSIHKQTNYGYRVTYFSNHLYLRNRNLRL